LTEQRLIPVSIVTGFLGCGKTTLIRRLLRDSAFGRTAVIVNEFGDVALDHDLIASSDESVLTLNTGCLCCAVQTDLARTLVSLLDRRADYNRVLIETSGLADPGLMLQAMMTDRTLAGTYASPAIVTVVDTVHGEETLRWYAEASAQIAVADRLLISKTDLRSSPAGLSANLDQLNPRAPRMATPDADIVTLFNPPAIEALAGRAPSARRPGGHSGIDTFTVSRDRPLPALALTLLLEAIAEHCGSRLLRLKGLVAIEEMPGQPALIHGVRHVVSPPDFLDRWPSADETTRMVFITKGIPRFFISRLLDAIEEEVRQEQRLARNGPAS
jgi:G3E family GTPase